MSATMESTTPRSSSRLRKSIGAAGYFTLAFGAIIGSGWIIVLGDWLRSAGPGGAVVGFLAGGAAVILIGLGYAELTARMPRAGGEFLYAHECLGPKAAFIVGWFMTLYMISIPAFEGIILGVLVQHLVPSLKYLPGYDFLGQHVVFGSVAIGLTGALIMGALNVLGSRVAVGFQNWVTFSFLGVVAIVVAIAAYEGSAGNLQPFFPNSDGAHWLSGAFWIFSTCGMFLNGFQAALHAIEERDDRTSLRGAVLSMVAAIAVAAIFYCLIVLAAAGAAPWRTLLSSDVPAVAAFAASLPGGILGTVVIWAAIVSLLKTWNAMVVMASRFLFAQARLDYLPGGLGKISRGGGVPANAIVIVTFLSACMIPLGRGFVVPIVNAMSICLSLSYVMCMWILLKLRSAETADTVRPAFRLPGGKWLIWLAMASASLMAAIALIGPALSLRGIPPEWVLIAIWAALGLVLWSVTRKSHRLTRVLPLVCFAILVGAKTPTMAAPLPSDWTLERLLRVPFPSPAVAAPTKGRFAWVQEMEGRRSIWLAEPAQDGVRYRSRRLIEFSEDDGLEVGELAFTPDASDLIFVRGGDMAFPGAAVPNPASRVGRIEQAIWEVRVDDGVSRKLANGHSPSVSPRGNVVAFVEAGQIWLTRLDSSEPPQQVTARGTNDSLRWSPSGEHVAFVSARGDHSFIGVYTLGSSEIRYLDPHTTLDQEPTWSPDSERVAFVRVPWTKPTLGGPRPTGPPWSIVTVSITSGRASEVWRAPEGTGSVFIPPVFSRNHLFWAANQRIVFLAEIDGWSHLHSVASEGGPAQLLTPGAFEVEWVDLSQDRRTLVYSSNQNDPDRRHLWKLSVAGGATTALTNGSGIENAPVIGGRPERIVYLRSDATHPLRAAAMTLGGQTQDLIPESIASDYPSGAFALPEAVRITSADGGQFQGQLLLPPKSSSRTRHPAVIFLHGGPERQMLLGFHYVEYYHRVHVVNQFLASRGYVVLSINYRSGTGYGAKFREAPDSGLTGASEFSDVLAAGRYLQERTDVDPARIGIWGKSYGGFLTALALARASNVFAAGVDISGISDWSHSRFITYGRATAFPGDSDPREAQVAFSSSPLASIGTWRSPVLIIHSDDDRNVPFSEAVRLAAALRSRGIAFEEMIVPDDVHAFTLYRNRVAEMSATVRFFERQFQR